MAGAGFLVFGRLWLPASRLCNRDRMLSWNAFCSVLLPRYELRKNQTSVFSSVVNGWGSTSQVAPWSSADVVQRHAGPREIRNKLLVTGRAGLTVSSCGIGFPKTGTLGILGIPKFWKQTVSCKSSRWLLTRVFIYWAWLWPGSTIINQSLKHKIHSWTTNRLSIHLIATLELWTIHRCWGRSCSQMDCLGHLVLEQLGWQHVRDGVRGRSHWSQSWDLWASCLLTVTELLSTLSSWLIHYEFAIVNH